MSIGSTMAASRGLRSALQAAVALVALALVLSCRSEASHAEVVARLAELHGPVSKELADKRDSWTGVGVGASFALGDAVRTQLGATARVEMVRGGAVSLTEGTTVRFLMGGSTVRHLSVETGEAEVEPGGSALELETLIGMAQLEPGSRVRVATKTGQVTFDVLMGGAELEAASDGRAARSVKAGQRYKVSIGSAGVEGIEPLLTADASAGDARAAGPDAAHDAPTSALIVAEVHGAGVRASASRGDALAALAEGTAQLAEGSRLLIPEGATVDLTRGDEQVTLLGGSDVEVGGGGAALVQMPSGRLMVKSRRPGGRVGVPRGYIELVTVGPGEVQAEVRVERKTSHVVSNHGEILLHGDVQTATVGPGQSGTLDARGKATVDEARATTADLTIAAGESATVHSAKGSATVRISRTDCPADALVEAHSGGTARRTFARADDPTTGILRFGAGSHDYSVSCVGGADLQKGTLRIVSDAGVAHLALSAATNVVEADGRHYHVLYQGRLPKMMFRWPGAPADAAVTLHAVARSGAERRFPAPGGRAELPGGSMSEGSHRFWFDVDGHPDRKSPDTSLVVQFDNAAPAAEITAPVDGQPLSATVHVGGVAGDGASVSVSGVPLTLDAQSRFNGDVPGPPADNRVLAVRIAHPVRGTHYYLRTFGPPSGDAP